MRLKTFVATTVTLLFLLSCTGSVTASEAGSSLEKCMSDTLDSWREGRYEQLFEQLAHRGKTSREIFVKNMQDSTIRPACCWQKIENFKVLNEKQNEATVYAKIGIEETSNTSRTATREFKLTYQEGVWKMQLADILSIAEVAGKKGSTKRRIKKSDSYYN